MNNAQRLRSAVAVFALVASGWVYGCGSNGGGGDGGTVSCTGTALHCDQGGSQVCCPTAKPYFCGAPPDLSDYGCYATMTEATAVCGSVVFNGQDESLAVQCQ
jgi:hypothetical protein